MIHRGGEQKWSRKGAYWLCRAPREIIVPECTAGPLAEGQRHDVGTGGRRGDAVAPNKAMG